MARMLKNKLSMPKKRSDEEMMDEELAMDLGEEDNRPVSELSDEEFQQAAMEDESPAPEQESELQMYSDDEIMDEMVARGLMDEEERAAKSEAEEEPSEEAPEEEPKEEDEDSEEY